MIRAHVLICGGTGCTSSGSASIQKAFEENLQAFDLLEEVKLVQTGCFGLCELGPVVIVYPDGTFYSRVTPDDVKEIVEEHLLKGRIVERLVYSDTGAEEVNALGLIDHVTVSQTGCIGICEYEPVVEVFEAGKEKVTYVKMDAEKAKRVAKEHLKEGKVVTEFVIKA